MILYKLTFANGKIYIGQTQKTLKVRMQHHRQNVKHGSQLAVHCAWRKHGEPDIAVIGEYSCAAVLHRAEIAAIKLFGSLAPAGYNIGYGGETAPSKNPEVAAKIATKATGRKVSEYARQRSSEQMAERMADSEYRAKVDAAVKASWTPERRAAASELARQRATGVKFTDERRRKISEAKRNITPETRAKMSASAKARGCNNAFTDETRAKLSANAKAKWADKEHAEARKAAALAARMSPEGRAKQQAAAKATWADPEVKARRIAAIKAGHARRRAAQKEKEVA